MIDLHWTFAQLKRITDSCPIALMKCVKNDTEIAGMKNAHVSIPFFICWAGKIKSVKLTTIPQLFSALLSILLMNLIYEFLIRIIHLPVSDLHLNMLV